MYFSKTALVPLLLAAGSVLASPLALEAREVQVGFGQQIQNADKTNHWVVWYEGKSACPATVTLSDLDTSPCNQTFNLNGGQYQLVKDNEPEAVADDQGNIVHGCATDKTTINCHNGLHDIVKHGKCT